MAVTYGEGVDSGVIVGADSRTSTGSYVANRVSDKLTPVHDSIYCCRSGSTADTQAVADYVRHFLAQHAITLDSKPQVKTAAYLFQKLVYNNKDRMSASIICAGWDPVSGCGCGRLSSRGSDLPHIHRADTVPVHCVSILASFRSMEEVCTACH